MTVQEAEIRRLAPAEAAEYRQLMLAGYAEAADAFTVTVAERDALPLEWWAARLAEVVDAPEQVFGAMVAGRLVGVVGLRYETRVRTQHKATLFGLYLSLPHRRQGLARRLVLAALAAARQRPGTLLVQLTATDSNQAARRLYESCGFKVFGEEPMAVAVESGFLGKTHLWCRL